MKRLFALAALAFAIPGSSNASAVAQPPPATAAGAIDPAGDWLGTLETGMAKLRLALHLRRDANGALAGSLDSLDQGTSGIPLSNIVLKDGTLSFDSPVIGAHYRGAWNGDSFAGEWSQQALKAPLAFSRGSAAVAPPVAGLDGDWDGTLQLGPMGSLRIVFHIETRAGSTSGTLSSPDQGPNLIALSTIARAGRRITLAATSINGRFEGEAAASDQAIAGIWTQNGQAMPLSVKRRAPGAAAPAALNRPQMPAPPFPYRAIDVAFDNPAGPSHLAGTLTLPSGSGPFPAALLVSGSGQQDRDETLMGHKPFLVLADYLTRRGIAVLRVDDRGVGGSTGDVLHATSADFAGDAEAALAFLKSRPEIAPARIGIVGHSEGGMIGAMAAAKSPLVAWLVTMAGPGVRGHELILAQQRLIWAAAGETAPQLDKREKVGRAVIAALIEAPTEVDARDRARAILTEAGYADAVGDQAIAMMASDWYRYLLRYDPAPALRQLRIPVLAVNGSLDLQVPAKDNLAAIRSALAGNSDATIVELPGLNHLFQTARTGALVEYQQIEETMSPAALAAIGDWIVAHTR